MIRLNFGLKLPAAAYSFPKILPGNQKSRRVFNGRTSERAFHLGQERELRLKKAMLKFFERLSKFDPVLTVGGWGWGVLGALGFSGAAILTWLLFQIDWLWQAYGIAGFVVSGLFSFSLCMLTLQFFHPRTGDNNLISILVFAGLACFVTVAIIVARDRAPIGDETETRTSKTVKAPQPILLTEDQKQFRVSLKHFSLATLPKLAQAQMEVLWELKRKEVEISRGSANSIALHFFMHFYIGTYASSETIKAQATVDIEKMDVVALQRSIHQYFREYDFTQSAIGNMNAITKLDLMTVASAQKWFAIDAECRNELQKLQIWGEADLIKHISHEDVATGRARLWGEQYLINYQ